MTTLPSGHFARDWASSATRLGPPTTSTSISMSTSTASSRPSTCRNKNTCTTGSGYESEKRMSVRLRDPNNFASERQPRHRLTNRLYFLNVICYNLVSILFLYLFINLFIYLVFLYGPDGVC